MSSESGYTFLKECLLNGEYEFIKQALTLIEDSQGDEFSFTRMVQWLGEDQEEISLTTKLRYYYRQALTRRALDFTEYQKLYLQYTTVGWATDAIEVLWAISSMDRTEAEHYLRRRRIENSIPYRSETRDYIYVDEADTPLLDNTKADVKLKEKDDDS